MNPNFTDTRGITWNLRINIKHYMSFKEQGLVDLAKIFDDQDFLAGLLDHADMLGFLGILHELCEDQYANHSIADSVEFFEGFDGDVIQLAAEAFIAAVVAFSPAHRRNALTEAYTTMKLGLQTAGETATEQIISNREKQLKDVSKNAKNAISSSLRKTT